MIVGREVLRERGAKCEAWSDRCVGGASAFLIAAVWTSMPFLYIPMAALGVVALVLFALALVLGGRAL